MSYEPDPYEQTSRRAPSPGIKRINITMPASMQSAAWDRMAKLGMDFSEYVRHLIREDLKAEKAGK